MEALNKSAAAVGFVCASRNFKPGSRAKAVLPAADLFSGFPGKDKRTRGKVCLFAGDFSPRSLAYGATGRTRTGDLLITNQLLYQLSHSSITAGVIGGYYFILFVFFCQDEIIKNLLPARNGRRFSPKTDRPRCVICSFSAQQAPFSRCARSAPAKRRGSSRSCPASGRGKTAA